MNINHIAFKKIGLVVGILAGISSLIGLINIFIFNNNYSYMAIGLGIFSFYIGLSNYFKEEK